MDALWMWGAYSLVGVLAGFLGGLLGIGGGVISVPLLFYLFHVQHLSPVYEMHMAIATSLAATIFTTLAASWTHHTQGNILWKIFYRLVPGLIVGSVIGALIAGVLPSQCLKIAFGIFLIALALYFRISRAPFFKAGLPGPGALLGYSCAIASIANILGIGGGSVMVPFLTAVQVRTRQAIGTSAVATCLTATLGTLCYLMLGRAKMTGSPFGFIEPQAFLVVSLVSLATASIGAKLTHRVDPKRLRKIFALVLIATGLLLMI